MAAPIESITSKQQSNKQNCNDVSDVERIIADIFIDDDVVAAAAAADAIAEDEDDVINTVDTVKQTENCSSNSSKSDCDEIDSSIPPGFNDIDHIFHIDFMRSMQSLISQQEKRFKNGTRRSCTFTNEEMRQIERENRILLNKILAQRPKNSDARRQQVTADYQMRSSSASRVSSAAINRRQQQQRIDFDNNILRKKIERIARRSAK